MSGGRIDLIVAFTDRTKLKRKILNNFLSLALQFDVVSFHFASKFHHYA